MRFLLAILLFCVVSACVPNERDVHPSGPIRVKIPVLTEAGNYDMRTVELHTVDNIKTFGGSSARFFFAPAREGNKLVGMQPTVKLGQDNDGVYFALDTLSLQILTIYYHAERLRAWDQVLGIDSKTSWPKTIAVNAQIPDASSDMKHNNAFFWPDVDAMVFVPYTQSNLPISLNGAVIGHEHFHFIFENQVLRPMKQNKVFEADEKEKGKTEKYCSGTVGRKRYLTALTRAANEGFADVWGWLYTGDTRFVERSLQKAEKKPNEAEETLSQTDSLCRSTPTTHRKVNSGRDLDSEVKGTLESCECLHRRVIELTNKENLKGNETTAVSYHIGSRMAKVIKQFITSAGDVSIKALSFEDRKKIALSLLKGLERLQQVVVAMKSDEWLSPGDLVSLVTQDIDYVEAKNCQYLQSKVGKGSRIRVCGKQSAPVKPPAEGTIPEDEGEEE